MALIRASSPLRLTKPDLVASCIGGDIAGVRRALCSGCDPNEVRRGQTPLMYAAEGGHAEICELLLSNGAQVNATDTYSRTALYFACKNLHEPACRVLMTAGARNDIPCTLGGETPGDIVHMKGMIEIVRTVMFFGRELASPTKAAAPHSTAVSSAPAEKAAPAAESAAAPPPAPIADAPPVAVNFPRPPPAPEQDNNRRAHTPPRRVG